MGELNTVEAKARDLGRRNSTLVQTVDPKIGSTDRDRLQDNFGLVRPAPATDRRFAERECGDDGRGVGVPRTTMKVVDRQHAIKQHRALDRMQAQRLGVEILVILRAVGRHRQVVPAAYFGHGLLLRLSVKGSGGAVPTLDACK